MRACKVEKCETKIIFLHQLILFVLHAESEELTVMANRIVLTKNFLEMKVIPFSNKFQSKFSCVFHWKVKFKTTL